MRIPIKKNRSGIRVKIYAFLEAATAVCCG